MCVCVCVWQTLKNTILIRFIFSRKTFNKVDDDEREIVDKRETFNFTVQTM